MADKSTDKEPTKEELLEEARELDIEGRSTMSKDELAAAVAAAPEHVEVTDELKASMENALRNADGSI
jgi:hypothetical protein